jgi:hypothetical protein
MMIDDDNNNNRLQQQANKKTLAHYVENDPFAAVASCGSNHFSLFWCCVPAPR